MPTNQEKVSQLLAARRYIIILKRENKSYMIQMVITLGLKTQL